jgi:hypothetical protein
MSQLEKVMIMNHRVLSKTNVARRGPNTGTEQREQKGYSKTFRT